MFKQIRDFIDLVFNAFLWQPLRGGNGVTQPNELAKYLTTWAGIWMVFHEGVTEGQQFTDYQFGIVFGAVVAIAGFQLIYPKKPKQEE